MNRRPRVVVIGLGPAGPELITAAASAHWNNASAGTRFTRTDRHPSVAVLGSHRSFDDHYERATNLVEVYPAIVDTLVGQARAAGQVVYAVPGSPLVAERTVELLRGDKRVDVVIEPALSFLDLAWARLGVDPLACGVRLVDGHRFASEAAGERGPLLVAQCDHRDVLSDVKLSIDPWPKEPAVVLARLGLPDESVTVVAWEDLDRVVEADHLTSLWIPSLTAPVGSELVALAEVVGRLRRECPWDRAQTHHSLARYVLEEAYEVVETLDNLDLDSGDGAEDLADELGDLLFQVYLHSEMAAQAGWFTLADVARGIHDKMLRRHPHVFAPEASSMPGVATLGEPGSSDALVLEDCPALPATIFARHVRVSIAAAAFPRSGGVAAPPPLDWRQRREGACRSAWGSQAAESQRPEPHSRLHTRWE